MVKIGVDVGSTMARAGLFDSNGTLISQSSVPIQVINRKSSLYGYSSLQIWDAVLESIRESIRKGNVDPNEIESIGFDATCSLVCLDQSFQPVPLEEDEQVLVEDVIMWMDHR
jgi:D-ribulokinase